MRAADFASELQHNPHFQRRRHDSKAAVEASRQQRLDTVTRAIGFLESAGKPRSCTSRCERTLPAFLHDIGCIRPHLVRGEC